MKILFLAHRIPWPPNKGEKIRAYHELRFLAERHTIDLLCLADSNREASARRELESFCRRVVVEQSRRLNRFLGVCRAFLCRKPLSVGYFHHRRLHAAVREALANERYDVVFVYGSAMAQYVPDHCSTAVVVDFVDADSAKWAQFAGFAAAPQRWLYAYESRALAAYESKVVCRAAASVVATSREARELCGTKQLPVSVIENGVEVPVSDNSAGAQAEVSRWQPYLLFVGTMNYKPSVDAVVYFVREIFPAIRARHPELRFLIVGRDPSRPVRRLGKTAGVVVTGEVSDVGPYLQAATVVVAPFRISQGIHNKILEALAAGVPVVTTPRPAEVIGELYGAVLRVADTPQDFTRAVLELLESPAAEKAQVPVSETLRTRFNWESNLRRFEQLLEEVSFVRSGTRTSAPADPGRGMWKPARISSSPPSEAANARIKV